MSEESGASVSMQGLSPEWSALESDVAGLDGADLSPWFNPFLPRIIRETRRVGGNVLVLRDGDRLRALSVSDSVEHLATVFTRSRDVAEQWVNARGPFGTFADFSVGSATEPYDVLRIDLGRAALTHRFRHTIRPLVPGDVPEVLSLLRQVYGAVNERWLRDPPAGAEQGFVCDLSGRAVGAGWVALEGAHGRLHSLTVSPAHRGLGVAQDLVAARLLWAQQMGALEVLSEIARENGPSQSVARRLGMRPVGEIYFHRPR